MKTIWKYNIPVTDGPQEIKIPKYSQILFVSSQYPQDPSSVQMWVLVNPDAELTPRLFLLVGTGHPLPPDPYVHVGTAICFGGDLVWHLLEVSVA